MKAIIALKYLSKILRAKDGAERDRFEFLEKIGKYLYPEYKFSEFGRTFLQDKEFIALYERFEGVRNYHSLDRKYTIDQLAQMAVNIPGDTAECGAYKGASSYFICRRTKGANKHHHVFDSFEGLSSPGERDGQYWTAGDLSATEEEIRGNLAEFDFVRYHKGWIPERFSEVSDGRFSLVHLDVDLYQPTLDSLAFFYERMSRGGVIVCDDDGFISCPGARRAMDEFFKDKDEPVVRLPTGQAMVIKV